MPAPADAPPPLCCAASGTGCPPLAALLRLKVVAVGVVVSVGVGEIARLIAPLNPVLTVADVCEVIRSALGALADWGGNWVGWEGGNVAIAKALTSVGDRPGAVAL